MLSPGAASAQDPPPAEFNANPGDHSFSDFGQCFNDAADSAIDEQGAEPRGSADGSTSPILNPQVFLAESWRCSLRYADEVFVPTSERILWSLAILMLVWYGIQHMLGRGVNLGSLLHYFMLIGFALIILDNYYRPTHNFFPANTGFVQVIAQQVIGWAQDIYRRTELDFDAAFATTRRVLEEGAVASQFQQDNDPDASDAVVTGPSGLIDMLGSGYGGQSPETGILDSILDKVFSGLGDFIVSVIVAVMQRGIGLVLWIIRWMLIGQYMWGFFMLSLLSLIGPLFVPAIVISQVDWLFWNWLRGLLSACIYMLSSAALYSVSMILLLTPLSRITTSADSFRDPESGFGAALLWLGVTFLEYIPIFFLVAYMSLQAGTVASGLMSGSGPSSLSMATRALKRGISYTMGAAPVIASGVVQRGATGAVAGLGAYRWLRTLGPGGGDPSAGSGDAGGGSSGGGPSGGGPSQPSSSGDSGTGIPGPRTAGVGPAGGFGAGGGPGLSPSQRAALSAQLTLETNEYLDSRVADRLADMGHPSAGGGAMDRLRDAERAQLLGTSKRSDGTYQVDGVADDPRAQPRDARAQQHAYQAARIASMHHVLLWDDVARRQQSGGGAAIGPAGDAGGSTLSSSSDQAAQAAAAAAAASGESASSGRSGLLGRARGLRASVERAFEPQGRSVHELGTDFDRRVRDAADRGRAETVAWVRHKARDRWNDYWGRNN